jgi:hypothetical protein
MGLLCVVMMGAALGSGTAPALTASSSDDNRALAGADSPAIGNAAVELVDPALLLELDDDEIIGELRQRAFVAVPAPSYVNTSPITPGTCPVSGSRLRNAPKTSPPCAC